MSIGNTEALEKYLKLEQDNKALLDENKIYREELEKMRKAYSNLAKEVDTLYNWLSNRDKTKAVRRRMAEIFKFAYMENDFEDMKAKWPINQKASFVPKVSGESAPGVGDGSDPKKCSNLPIERQLRTSKTSLEAKPTKEKTEC